MPYEQSWLIMNEVIHSKRRGDLTVEELVASTAEIVQKLDSSNRPLVHLLVDLHDVTSQPMKLQVINLALKPLLSHPRLGWILFYGSSNQVLQFLTGMIAQIMRTRCRFFDTYAEAVQFLQSVDQSLETLPELP